MSQFDIQVPLSMIPKLIHYKMFQLLYILKGKFRMNDFDFEHIKYLTITSCIFFEDQPVFQLNIIGEFPKELKYGMYFSHYSKKGNKTVSHKIQPNIPIQLNLSELQDFDISLIEAFEMLLFCKAKQSAVNQATGIQQSFTAETFAKELRKRKIKNVSDN